MGETCQVTRSMTGPVKSDEAKDTGEGVCKKLFVEGCGLYRVY